VASQQGHDRKEKAVAFHCIADSGKITARKHPSNKVLLAPKNTPSMVLSQPASPCRMKHRPLLGILLASLTVWNMAAGFPPEPAALVDRIKAGVQPAQIGPKGNEAFSNQIAHLVDAYVTLHEIDRSPRWLDLAAEQLDKVAAATDRWYRNGIGWSTPRYSANLLRNLASAPPAGWVWLHGTAESFAFGDGLKLTGANGAAAPVAGQRLWNASVQDNQAYEPGGLYQVRGQFRSSSQARGIVTVLDRAGQMTFTRRLPPSADWTAFDFDFPAPSTPGGELWLLVSWDDGTGAGFVELRNLVVAQYAGHLIDEALMLNAFLRFIGRVRVDPAANTAHRERAKRYLTLARTIAGQWDQDWRPGRGFAVFRYADDGAAQQFARATVPTNYFTEAGVVYLRLHQLTGEKHYRRKATSLAQALRRQLRVEDDCLVWDYHRELLADLEPKPGPIPNYIEDITHGNSTVLFILEAHRAGVEFVGRDVRQLCRTLTRRLWNQNSGSPLLAKDLSGKTFPAAMPYAWQWLRLAEFDPEVLSIILGASRPYLGFDPDELTTNPARLLEQGSNWQKQQKAILALMLIRQPKPSAPPSPPFVR
jgi:hypothetical protein